jgi:hypothetical protein
VPLRPACDGRRAPRADRPGCRQPIVVRLVSGSFSAAAVPGHGVHALALGTEWPLGDSDPSPDGVHEEATTLALDWRSGPIVERDQADPLGP